MTNAERFRWEASQLKWDPEALRRALASQSLFPGASSASLTTSTTPEPTTPEPLTPEDIALAAYRKSQSLTQQAVWADRNAKKDRRAEYARRGKENQQKGSQWEGVVLQFFTRLGYTASRVLETHGYTKGWDIGLKELPGLVIQCKNTQTKAALLNGLEEAREHNSDQVGWVCFHRFRVKKAKKGQQYEYLVAYSGAPTGPVSITDLESFYRIMERAPGQYPNG